MVLTWLLYDIMWERNQIWSHFNDNITLHMMTSTKFWSIWNMKYRKVVLNLIFFKVLQVTIASSLLGIDLLANISWQPSSTCPPNTALFPVDCMSMCMCPTLSTSSSNIYTWASASTHSLLELQWILSLLPLPHLHRFPLTMESGDTYDCSVVQYFKEKHKLELHFPPPALLAGRTGEETHLPPTGCQQTQCKKVNVMCSTSKRSTHEVGSWCWINAVYFPGESDWWKNLSIHFTIWPQYSKCECPDTIFMEPQGAHEKFDAV